MTTYRQNEDIVTELLAASDGATVSTVPGVYVPDSGYAVGLGSEHGLVLNSNDYGPRIYAKVESWLNLARLRSDFVGFWADNGKLYFDSVQILPERADAINKGKARGELAIYNIGSGEVIDLV